MTDEVIDKPAAAAPAAPAAAPAPAASAPAATASPAPAKAATGVPSGEAPPKTADAPAEPPPKWSATWREDMAGDLPETATAEEKAEHDKLLKRLHRYNTPADVAKALREQDKLISSGALKKALPKNPTPEQLAEWRKDNGIPESPDKYDLALPKDAELNEVDRDMLAEWAASAHAVNATPEMVQAGAKAYVAMRAKVAAQVEQRNTEARDTTMRELAQEWGVDYKTNVDGVKSMLANAESAAVVGLLEARTPDGVQIMNNPDVMRWLAGKARELGFVGATIVPAGHDVGQGIDDEIASMKERMRKDPDGWYKDNKAQARFQQLHDAKARMAARK